MNSKIFQVILIGLGCASFISATVEITASYTGQDRDSFELGSNATFTCTISPYNGVQTWKVDNNPVSSCGFTDCEQNTSNPDRYLFMPDRSAGIFIFTISFVEHADNGKVIECFGAGDTDKKTLTMVVTGTTTQTYDTVTNSNASNENSVFTTVESSKQTSHNTDKLPSTTIFQSFSLSTTRKHPEKKIRIGLYIVVGVISFCFFVPLCSIIVFIIFKQRRTLCN